MHISTYGYLSVVATHVMATFCKEMILNISLWRLWSAARKGVTSQTKMFPAVVTVKTWGSLQWNTDWLSDMSAMLGFMKVSGILNLSGASRLYCRSER